MRIKAARKRFGKSELCRFYKVFTHTSQKQITMGDVMKNLLLTLAAVSSLSAQETIKVEAQPSKVDYSGFVFLTNEVQSYRAKRLVEVESFLEMAKLPNTIILDTRSERNFKARHLKGAIHLNFSEFSEEKLAKLIPDKNTRILIYCNNNFEDDPETMVMKSAPLALNIPTFVNLYGYGYKNVYELSDLLSIKDARIQLGGELEG